jgi:hypothetical protein
LFISNRLAIAYPTDSAQKNPFSPASHPYLVYSGAGSYRFTPAVKQ